MSLHDEVVFTKEVIQLVRFVFLLAGWLKNNLKMDLHEVRTWPTYWWSGFSLFSLFILPWQRCRVLDFSHSRSYLRDCLGLFDWCCLLGIFLWRFSRQTHLGGLINVDLDVDEGITFSTRCGNASPRRGKCCWGEGRLEYPTQPVAKAIRPQIREGAASPNKTAAGSALEGLDKHNKESEECNTLQTLQIPIWEAQMASVRGKPNSQTPPFDLRA